MQNILQKTKYILHEHWLDLFLMAYLCTCVDILITTYGILAGIGKEGNPLVTAIIPSNFPLYQIGYITIGSILAFWGMYFCIRHLLEKYRLQSARPIISIGMVWVSYMHLYGASTWLIV